MMFFLTGLIIGGLAVFACMMMYARHLAEQEEEWDEEEEWD